MTRTLQIPEIGQHNVIRAIFVLTRKFVVYRRLVTIVIQYIFLKNELSKMSVIVVRRGFKGKLLDGRFNKI